MARTPLNKAELARKKRELATYQRFLPSLEMKRKQLLAERQRARRELDEVRAAVDERRQQIADDLPMLADRRFDLDGLVRLRRVETTTENLVGVALPRLQDVHFEVAPYGTLATPHWIDRLVELLCDQLRERARQAIAEARLAALEDALKTVTQRLNLFDKVLIPRTRETIKRIEIALGDAERAAVVRAKIAKGKRAEATS